MANALMITNEQAVNRATVIKATFASGQLRLLANYTPNYTDNRAVLLSNEANFTGYPAGGYNVAAWTGPALPGSGGSSITSPIVTVEPASNNTITNNISGFWYEVNVANVTSTYLTGTFQPYLPVTTPLDQFPIVVQDYEGLAVSPV
jgi:hypothetical protein